MKYVEYVLLLMCCFGGVYFILGIVHWVAKICTSLVNYRGIKKTAIDRIQDLETSNHYIRNEIGEINKRIKGIDNSKA